MEVTLEEMLSAREARSFRQFRLSRQWGMTLNSFSMNIPGPVKDTPLVRRAFREGCRKLEERLPGDSIKYQEAIAEKNRMGSHLCGGYGCHCRKSHYHLHRGRNPSWPVV